MENDEDEFFKECYLYFHSKDFVNTTNEEVLMMKNLLFNNDSALNTPEQTPVINKIKRLKISMSPSVSEKEYSTNHVKITFINHGEITCVHGEKCRLRYRKTMIIPDGLCGTHKMFQGYWKFEIKYHDVPEGSIEWSIVDLENQDRTGHKESSHQVQVRERSGRTVCNYLVREALKKRCERLEDGSLLKNTYLKLCNGRITIGPIFFGLHNKEVISRPSTPFPTTSD